MAFTNAEKQRRWRERNQVTLAARAEDIASQLIEMDDQAKLRKIAKFVNDHLKHPDRSAHERLIALGVAKIDGLNGQLSKTKALASLREEPQDYSWGVVAKTGDGRRWRNGARFKTREEVDVYIDSRVRFDLEKSGYVSAEIVRYDGESNMSITRSRKGGRPTLNFMHGECRLLNWSDESVT